MPPVKFFGLLDFVEKTAVVVSGEEMAGYMGIPGGPRTTSPWS